MTLPKRHRTRAQAPVESFSGQERGLTRREIVMAILIVVIVFGMLYLILS
jgi:hypothetical protein